MQYSTVFGLAAFLSTVAAAPAPRAATGTIVFKGAADAEYTLTVPLDGTDTPTSKLSLFYYLKHFINNATDNVLSISSVTSSTINVASQCVLHTVDYPPALVEGPANTWVVGPPQTVTSISCTGPYTPPNPPLTSISIEFQGADPTLGAKYTVVVPLNGQAVATNNVLSISTLVSTYPISDKCTFQYIDGSAALAKIAADKWAVGPPQTITSVSCTA
jgi:hypothetical protein